MSGVRQHPTLHTLGSEGIGEILWNSAPDGDGDYFYNNDQSVQQQKKLKWVTKESCIKIFLTVAPQHELRAVRQLTAAKK